MPTFVIIALAAYKRVVLSAVVEYEYNQQQQQQQRLHLQQHNRISVRTGCLQYSSKFSTSTFLWD